MRHLDWGESEDCESLRSERTELKQIFLNTTGFHSRLIVAVAACTKVYMIKPVNILV